ncbi:uncharacterized protein with NRDE domain [Salirhabdus euzebyi]|uniref:Uncharacterized protein with NRDE domain n=1 Tax=Salirhabdus euzebyi TaxID=394506 RepID=A0A841Q353_9BACI|nr:NRDE family protein [Salirhabdus euzebyi]MBB6452608.1 uncharacterized protein with NRDE domain [Salirhabdus euzebyi]
MCLISFAYGIDSTYKLIVGANRDEFFTRPTAPAHYWDDDNNILAGRDLEKMGTWMGVSKQGRFAALTNYRDPNENSINKRSRGELVSNFLMSEEEPLHYVQTVQEHHDQYPGFNLLAGDIHSLFYYSNKENKIRLLEPGIYGLSNHLLDTPWPKVDKGKEGLTNCLNDGINSIERFKSCVFSSLQNAEPAKDEVLPKTDIGLEWERKLSPMFIQTPDYGTRSSTVLLMNQEEVHFEERVFSKEGNHNNVFTFKI